MEKYRVSIDGKEYLVEIDGDRVWFDGQEIYAGIHFLNDDGLFMIERDKNKREFHVKLHEDDTYQVTTRGLQTDVIVEPEKKRRKKKEEPEDNNIVKAPIPGVVINLFVKNGDQVQANQVLIVLESMKMLMEFRASFAGMVEDVAVKIGQSLDKGDVMVRLKKEP